MQPGAVAQDAHVDIATKRRIPQMNWRWSSSLDLADKIEWIRGSLLGFTYHSGTIPVCLMNFWTPTNAMRRRQCSLRKPMKAKLATHPFKLSGQVVSSSHPFNYGLLTGDVTLAALRTNYRYTDYA